MKYTRDSSFLLVFLLLFCQFYSRADNRIIVYLKHAPLDLIKATVEKAQQEVKNSQEGLINKITKIKNFENEKLKNEYIKLLTPKLGGFMAIYGGFLDISNKDGIIQFPLRQTAQKLYIAFTDKIKLIKVKGNTFSHREFADQIKHPIKLYLYEKKVDNKNNSFWSVQEAKLPEDKVISPITMIFFTNPSNVVVQTGDFLSNNSQHFVLPEIYVIDTFNQALVDLGVLKVKRFFESVKFEEKPVSEKSTQGLLSNT